jgi:hypothetical protein
MQPWCEHVVCALSKRMLLLIICSLTPWRGNAWSCLCFVSLVWEWRCANQESGDFSAGKKRSASAGLNTCPRVALSYTTRLP